MKTEGLMVRWYSAPHGKVFEDTAMRMYEMNVLHGSNGGPAPTGPADATIIRSQRAVIHRILSTEELTVQEFLTLCGYTKSLIERCKPAFFYDEQKQLNKEAEYASRWSLFSEEYGGSYGDLE